MSQNENDDSEQSEQYTIDVNGKRYELTKEFRQAIQERAESEFSENEQFSCWWKVADATDADDGSTSHEAGDPILVIETRGSKVPWEDLDELQIEMEEVPQEGEDSDDSDDLDKNEMDNGNDVKTVPPDAVSDESESTDEDEELEGRSHFALTPKKMEDVPQPEEEDSSKIPPKPVEMGDESSLVWWVPSHPDMDEIWATGEAIVPCNSWVEWNVQARADQMRPVPDGEDKANSHDHFEALCEHYDCEKVGEYKMKDEPPRGRDEESGSVKRKGKDQFENGKYGGNNFHV